MPLFYYHALTKQGQSQTGDWSGASEKDLYQHLSKQQLRLLSSRMINTNPKFFIFPKKITLDMLIDFCIHMNQLHKVKMPLPESILALASNTSSKAFKAVLYKLHETITQGSLLSDACIKHPKVFDSIFIQCLSIAEKIGNLSQAFQDLEAHLKWKQNHQQQLRSSLRYPVILFALLMSLIGFMATFVTPHLQDFLQLLNVSETPFALKSLLGLCHYLQNYGYISLIILTSTILVFIALCKTSIKIRELCQKLYLALPGIGLLRKRLIVTDFIHSLSLLLGQKLELISSIEKSTETISLLPIQKKLISIPASIKKGSLLSHACSHTKLFKPLVIRLIQLGEESGSLSNLLKETAEFEKRNTLRHLQTLLAWTEPFLLIIMGIIMMWIVAATVVPLYDNLAVFDL
jgi:type IV pilus assembly protein PilC